MDGLTWIEIADMLLGGKGSFIEWAKENCMSPVLEASEETVLDAV